MDFEDAQRWDFHLDHYFPGDVVRAIDAGRSGFFFVNQDKGTLHVEANQPVDGALRPLLENQLAIVRARDPRGRTNRRRGRGNRAPAVGLWRLDASGSTSGGNRSTVEERRPVYALRYYRPGSKLRGWLSQRDYVDVVRTSSLKVRWLRAFAQAANELGLAPDQVTEEEIRTAARLGWRASKTSDSERRRMDGLVRAYKEHFSPEQIASRQQRPQPPASPKVVPLSRARARSLHPAVWVPIADLVATERIANSKNLRDLRALFEVYGGWPEGLPPVFVLSTGEIIDGHHRVEAARGVMDEAYAVVIDAAAWRDLERRGAPRGEAAEQLTGWRYPHSWVSAR